MRILHISFAAAGERADRVVRHLMELTSRAGHTVHLLSDRKSPDTPGASLLSPDSSEWQRSLLRRQNSQGLFDLFSPTLMKAVAHPLFEQADLIHLHCMEGGFFSFLLLPFLAAKPVVWTLHDPQALTGGCRRSAICDNWRTLCRDCPLDRQKIGQRPRRELVQTLKTAIYNITDFVVACPSLWLRNQVAASALNANSSLVIHDGVDTNTFRPENRAALRAKLGLPADKHIVMLPPGCHGDPQHSRYLEETLAKIPRPKNLLLIRRDDPGTHQENRSFPGITICAGNDDAILAGYYAAADVYLSASLTEGYSLDACEAMACGTPVVAFSTGGVPELVTHLDTGYLAQYGDSTALAAGLVYFLENTAARRAAGEAARTAAIREYSAGQMAEQYHRLYLEMLKSAGGLSLLRWSLDETAQIAARTPGCDWTAAWRDFAALWNRFGDHETEERNRLADHFFANCLEKIDPVSQPETFWASLEQWHDYRPIRTSGSGLSDKERAGLRRYLRLLRAKLRQYFLGAAPTELDHVSPQRQQLLILVWQTAFFDNAPFLADEENDEKANNAIAGSGHEPGSCRWYLRLLTESMYRPFDSSSFNLDSSCLWDAPLPYYCKIILAYWLINTPYLNIEDRHRRRLMQYVPGLCRTNMPPRFFTQFVTRLMNSLWRASYVGGDNLQALTAFGDFISQHTARFFPRYAARERHRPAALERQKIRVGYISRLFYKQAVSYYMANRLIHHDRSRFSIHTFALGSRHDEMTDIIANNSDHFTRLSDCHDIGNIAKTIAESDLDILIYTDIGMDPFTYMLAGLQLAPAQCALVGHGTSTGMPCIQYYISGDFEHPAADAHYREKLLRLPTLGAAQYPPDFASGPLPGRRHWGIPEDVVIFVSCANGIKHGPERDELLIRILASAPAACIVLKPCFSPQEDAAFSRRLMAKARAAGFEDRLFIIPPLQRVEALLAISDIQLDTYPYGGWTTNMEALYMGLPLVTQEGGLGRSRWGAGMLRALGITAGIAADEADYVDWAVKMAGSPALRAEVSQTIKARVREVLFNGAAAQSAYEETLAEIFRETHTFRAQNIR